MERGVVDESQVALLLRVGVGTVWLYEGLVGNILAPDPSFLRLIAAWPWIPAPPELILGIAGACETLLGLLLIRGWMVRPLAIIQGVVLVLSTAWLGVVMPQARMAPLGGWSKNGALIAADLCLALVGTGGRRSDRFRSAWLIPLILRLGLGWVWIYEGLVPKWLAPALGEIQVVARSGLVAAHIPSFLKLLGVAEAGVGLTLLAGLWVRELAVLQAGLLSAFTAVIAWSSPHYLVDPLGGLVKNVALLGCVLVLYRTGGGAYALDGWLSQSVAWRRSRLGVLLQWNRLIGTAAAEIFGVQAQAAMDSSSHALLEKLALDEEHHVADLTSLLRRHGGRPAPLVGVARGIAWTLGCITVIFGMRVSLRFDLWMEEQRSSLYGRCVDLLPPEAGITARALLGMQNQEALHIRLLRDHVRAGRPRARR